jgi:hypothetical protein
MYCVVLGSCVQCRPLCPRPLQRALTPISPAPRAVRRELLPRRGEFQIDSMNGVEDTKGNNGERGELRITNLRVVWWAIHLHTAAQDYNIRALLCSARTSG